MKLLKNLSIAAALCCACGGPDGALTAPGVSEDLATQRKDRVSGIHYELEFDIPESMEEKVTGREVLSFSLSDGKDLILDFTSPDYSDVQVNGKSVEAAYKDEHIIIPGKYLNAGENSVSVSFVSDDRFLNRNGEYLYTLFVPAHARSVFPCFDQPDLRAEYTLTLNIPEGWKAMSNTAAVSSAGNRVEFGRTKSIPTYLFSFVAGKWNSYTAVAGGREMTAFYRETDPAKTAQLPEIFEEVAAAVKYMEEYTGIPLPFDKYDFTIVPGFQFGGMEHPGAVLYNENTMFLGKNPSPDEKEKRITLLAHETAHMWFGDMVTMKWFNDVWTKEVYANYFAAEMAEPMFPEVNHELVWLKSYYVTAMAEDRTAGASPVRRPLGNLADAGLIYSNIVYDKAPIVMKKLVEFMGADNFRTGICAYLKKFAFGNATWDDLIEVLDAHSEKDVKQFSEGWIYTAGMPHVSLTRTADGIRVESPDSVGRPQSIAFAFEKSSEAASAELGGSGAVTVPAPAGGYYIPNPDGQTYALIEMPEDDLRTLLAVLGSIKDDTARESVLVTLNENYMQGRFSDPVFYATALLDALSAEKNEQIAASMADFVNAPAGDMDPADRERLEARLMAMSRNHPLASVRTRLLRQLGSGSVSSAAAEYIYGIWQNESDASLGADDYTTFAWQLAVRMPERADEILATQRSRIDGSDPSRNFNSDKLRRFDFVSPAASPRKETRDSLFAALLLPENRTVEPWAQTALALLNHFLRDEESVPYIVPGLEALEEVKATGDIFFPAAWCRSLLGSHRCPEAYDALQSFLSAHRDYPPLLMSKILINTYNLERANGKAGAAE